VEITTYKLYEADMMHLRALKEAIGHAEFQRKFPGLEVWITEVVVRNDGIVNGNKSLGKALKAEIPDRSIVRALDELRVSNEVIEAQRRNQEGEKIMSTNYHITISGGNFVGSQVGSSNSTLNAYMEALKIDSYSSTEEHQLKQALANLRKEIETDPSLKQPQRQAAALDFANFSEEIKKPLEEQDAEMKKFFWDRLTAITKFSAALVTLAAAVAKLTGLV
jgi:hypothetical protein